MSTADTGTRGSRPGDLSRRRVLLLGESAGLAAVLHHLLDPADRLSRLGNLRELAETRALENADVVVLDVAAEDRTAAVAQVRRRYLGPLVVLVTKGDDTSRLPLDDAATLLTRPFSAEALGRALAPKGQQRLGPFWTTITSAAPTVVPEPAPIGPVGPGTAAAANPAEPTRTTIDPKAAARKAPVRPAPPTPPGQVGVVERVQRTLVALTQGWKARRRVRVAGFSVFALVAFTVAFAVASQGRCGPGCDAFGTVFSPDPTIAASESTAPSTTGPKRSTTTARAAAGSTAIGAFRGISGGRLASTTTRQATATTPRPTATTRPATTRPATTDPPTTDPPTTAPPTTEPPPPTTAGR